ncbi:MAG: hypothetical protein RL196_1034 [Actinomycetota bacterium]|jgi:uncharacterized RDD family membrane protein YckC
MNAINDWPGQRLGLPADSAGSIARMGRRIGAISIDWALATLFSMAFFDYNPNASLLFFFVEQWLLVSTLGYSVGHRVFSIAVRRLDGHWVGFWRGFIRTGLICLVIPVAIWDADQRGLHDKAVSTVLVRI